MSELSASPNAAPLPSGLNNPLLQMEGVSKRFGATVALDGVDLDVSPGEVLALMGENGAGKSTLMKVLSGAHDPDAGQMWLDGKPYRPRGPLDARRSGVAMIYQELSLAPHLTVMENILLGMEPMRGPLVDFKSMRAKATAAMLQLGHPDIDLKAPVGTLSLGRQQLVEIGRAVAVGCRVLVLDEPTSSLTSKDIAHLFALVRRLRGQGMAIIYISHFLEEVKEISDRYTVLRDGRSVASGATASASQADIIAQMVGRSVDNLYPRSPHTPGEVVLDLSSVAGESKPLDASLTLRRGEVVGIAGLIGAGRTELLRSVFALDPVSSGKIAIAAQSGNTAETGRATPMQRWKQGLGMVSEDRKNEGLALGLSITDNLTMTRIPGLISPKRMNEDAEIWSNRLSVKCRTVKQNIGDLSGGNQQKVAIARLLYHNADVFLLDEPTRGIDVGSKAQIYDVINQLACEQKAVLVVSSYLPELLGICDRIAVMCRGVLGPARNVADVDERQIMMEAIGESIA